MTRLPILVTAAAVPLLVLAVWLEKEQDVRPRFDAATEVSLVRAHSVAYGTVSFEPAPSEDEFLSLQSREQNDARDWTFMPLGSSARSGITQRLTTGMRPVMDISDGTHALKAAVFRYSYTGASASQQEAKRYSF